MPNLTLRILAAPVALLLGAALAYTQTTPASDDTPPANFKGLTGDRFQPLAWQAMTPEQKAMIRHILSGDRKNLGGAFNILLRSPEMGDLASTFGQQARFHSSLPPRLNELAIIVTARYWAVQFEWMAHRRAAAQAGIPEETIQAIATGKRPSKLTPEETVVYNFATELLKNHAVSDATYAAAKRTLGERQIVDMICVMGYYQLVAMLMDVDRYPLPAGVQPELKPLAQSIP